MTQQEGELHAVHTFRGFTGCTFGVSAQRSTSLKCFKHACQASFDEHLAGKVKFVFSDTPLRIIQAARSFFKSLYAVGEDPIHFPIRLEYCFGGKTVKLTARVRQLHGKFRVPTSSVERFWQPEDVIDNTSVWPAYPTQDSRTPQQ